MFDEFSQVHAREVPGCRGQYEDEKEGREIACGDQLSGAFERRDPILADDVCHRTQSAQRRQSHDPADDHEEQMAQTIDVSEQCGDEEGLERCVLSEGRNCQDRNDVEQELGGGGDSPLPVLWSRPRSR